MRQKSALYNFQDGEYCRGLFNSAMAVSDVFMIKSLVTGAIKMSFISVAKKSSDDRFSTIYRAVSKSEMDDIAEFGFRTKLGGYESEKLFTTSMNEAVQFGKNNFKLDGIPNHIMKAKVPNSTLKSSYHFTADGMNAIGVPANQLHVLKGTPINFSIFKTF